MSGRAANGSNVEDIALCQAWLMHTETSISVDNFPLTAIIAPRSIGSIKARWRVIGSACTKYYAALLQVDRDRQSGQNADDRWNASVPTSVTDTEIDANQSEHNEEESIPLDSDNDPPAFQPLPTTRSRPQGRNAAKKAK
ncbi:hypothetical protein Q3G72_029543 [Acer saccharum]|nr:hypothetical protein Q3G72_029543 [Acer saccharum]